MFSARKIQQPTQVPQLKINVFRGWHASSSAMREYSGFSVRSPYLKKLKVLMRRIGCDAGVGLYFRTSVRYEDCAQYQGVCYGMYRCSQPPPAPLTSTVTTNSNFVAASLSPHYVLSQMRSSCLFRSHPCLHATADGVGNVNVDIPSLKGGHAEES